MQSFTRCDGSRPGCLVAALCFTALLCVPAVASAQTRPYVVEPEGCHHGDMCTFEQIDRDVHLAGIEAPEPGPCHPGMNNATKALGRLMARSDSFRVQILDEEKRDGRKVYVGRMWADGTNVSRYLLEKGLVVEDGEPTCPGFGGDPSSP